MTGTQYTYDARHLRVLVTNDAGYGEAFVYDLRGTVRGSYEASTGATTATYLAGFGFGEVLARVDGHGQAQSALRDRLGTAVGWLDQGGQMAEHIVRDSYGVRAGLPAAVVPFGYTGHAEDPTGLVWGRARCYAPTTGAWTGEDPVFTEGRYGYVRGSPSIVRDPAGRASALEYGVKLALTCTAAGGLTAALAYAWKSQLATDALVAGITTTYACVAGTLVGGDYGRFAGIIVGALVGGTMASRPGTEQ